MKQFKPLVLFLLTGLVLLGAAATRAEESKFVPPTDEQIAAAAKDPTHLKALIQYASADETVDVVVKVIKHLEKLDLDWKVKRARVAALFDVVHEVKRGVVQTIIARISNKVNPKLLPVIKRGSVSHSFAPLPPLPPEAPEYPGQ